MSKLFLLDAYALIYRSYYAFIRNPRFNSKGMNTSAILGFVNTLEDVLKKEEPTHIGIAFDPSGPTFRHEMYPEYKAQREATPEDIRNAIPYIKEIIKAYRIPILEVKGYEADDVIGTLATQAGKQKITTYMMTPDKDYGQLVTENVFMYKPKSGKGEDQILDIQGIQEKFKVEHPEQVIDLLGLMGDAVDNIPGCPGVGEKTAQKLIAQFGSIENLLEHTDQLKGKQKEKVEANKEQILFSKKLTTIKTDVPIELDLELLERKEIDRASLSKILEDLEFKALLKRIIGEETPSVKKEVKQSDLFDLFTTDTASEEKETNLRTLKDTLHNYYLLDNQKKRSIFFKKIAASKILVLDTETTHIEPMKAELVGMSFSIQENEAYYVPLPSDRKEAVSIVNEFKFIFENEKILKVGQNIKYDMMVLAHYDVVLKGSLFDTMIAHYLLQPELRHNMDYMAETCLHYKTISINKLIGPKGRNQKNMRDLSPEEVYEYACEDADITLQLYKKLKPELEKEGIDALFYDIEMPLVNVLASMEMNGVRLDTQALQNSSIKFTSQMEELEKEIHTMAGRSFNISSPRQVGDVLFGEMKISEKIKKTKLGHYSTSEEILLKHQHKHPIVQKILEYRGLKKLLSTYINALPELIHPTTGRIHTSFNQTVTATGRLSSSNPNLQNIPIRDENGKEIRKAFIPDEGCEFFSADYSQIELRIMAHLSNDPHLIEAFNKDEDIHASTAAKIYHKPIEEVTREERSKAKTANFGIIYGISTFGLAERMQVERKEAKALIEGYFNNYAKVKEYMDESITTAKEKGYVETIFHRKRYLADINSRNGIVRGYAERNAINAPIQGSAADIIKIAMIRIHERMQKEQLKAKLLLQIHDELNFSVPVEEKGKLQQLVVEEMQKACPMSVALKADYGWGINWLEAH